MKKNILKVKDKESKENPLRSISKAVSYRFLATGATFTLSFIIFDRYTEIPFSESVENAGLIAGAEFLAKIFLYYLHERLWTNIAWGKYWRRLYWGKKAWRNLYNNMHDEQLSSNTKS